ncbi:hypothetical protein EVAR_27580_1 [Eumeta japonica]|uniref:Uncharacterized protein n=1 Tax=Eumeta variegata TaxID=151549 RepID=A0A4C1WAW5_EUMVA|nr:hypothetical protein EVAR_27580_1 [Eumeta japonica]
MRRSLTSIAFTSAARAGKSPLTPRDNCIAGVRARAAAVGPRRIECGLLYCGDTDSRRPELRALSPASPGRDCRRRRAGRKQRRSVDLHSGEAANEMKRNPMGFDDPTTATPAPRPRLNGPARRPGSRPYYLTVTLSTNCLLVYSLDLGP